MAIKWTPWFSAPIHRRLELLGVLCYILLIISGPFFICCTLYTLYNGSIFWRTVHVAYLAFLYYDRNTSDRGGRGPGIPWIRSLKVWKYCMDYFPLNLVKTADLPSDRNYLFCIFPHGTLSIGAVGTFATSHSKWSTYFPGIRTRLITLRLITLMPFQREISMSVGISAATENSITTILSQSNEPNDESNRDGNTSNAVGLICGGLRESRVPTPNRYQCVVAKRRGFVRIALKTGASIVPVISFGESNIYKIVKFTPGSWSYRIETWIKKRFPNYIGILNGRGIFQYNFGIIPNRRPIHTVIGAPIHLEKNPNPSREELDRVHSVFCNELKKLFEDHKHKYHEEADNATIELI